MGGVQNSGRLPGGTYFSSNSCGEPTIPKWGDYSWVDHVIECPNLSLYHYFVYSHPPNIKHPLRNHGLVGKFHTSMGPFGSFFFKRGWDDENRLIHVMKCGDPNIAPVAQGNWHLI